MATIKPKPMHHQLADQMRQAIRRGRWAPGSQIPTEPVLSQMYGVSRATVRLAVQTLRAEGLLDVVQGRGSFVRTARDEAPRTTIQRAVTRTSASYGTSADEWTDVETPSVSHVGIDHTAAARLAIPEGESAFLIERLLAHPSGARIRHTILLPMEAITGTPLATPAPDITAAFAFLHLAHRHGHLEWAETVSARMPSPDERAALQIQNADATPLLISHRITRTQATGRPLMLETTTTPATSVDFAFTTRPTRPAPRTPV